MAGPGGRFRRRSKEQLAAMWANITKGAHAAYQKGTQPIRGGIRIARELPAGARHAYATGIQRGKEKVLSYDPTERGQKFAGWATLQGETMAKHILDAVHAKTEKRIAGSFTDLETALGRSWGSKIEAMQKAITKEEPEKSEFEIPKRREKLRSAMDEAALNRALRAITNVQKTMGVDPKSPEGKEMLKSGFIMSAYAQMLTGAEEKRAQALKDAQERQERITQARKRKRTREEAGRRYGYRRPGP